MKARIVERRADVTVTLLKVENEKLRAALQEIAADAYGINPRQIARKALTETQHD